MDELSNRSYSMIMNNAVNHRNNDDYYYCTMNHATKYFEFNYASHPLNQFLIQRLKTYEGHSYPDHSYDDDGNDGEIEDEDEDECKGGPTAETQTQTQTPTPTPSPSKGQFQCQSKSQSKTHTQNPEDKQTMIQRKNLIVWDWDDTIFPTYSFRTQMDKKDKHFMSKLSILVNFIEKIFEEMIKIYGSSNIIIVTNASETWIDKCLNVDIVQDTFWNFQQNILKKYNIKTVSASTIDITSKHPKNHYKWKEIVFDRIFRNHFDLNSDLNLNENTINCITSIGDSLCEYNASYTASNFIKNRILNRIRLKSNPTISDMIFQLKEILIMIKQFGFNIDDIDIDYQNSSNSSLSMSSSDTTC